MTRAASQRDLVLEWVDLVQHFPIKGSDKVVQAVNGVNLAFGPGETVALVGESGSGKSTVGKMILSLLKPTSGAIRFEGQHLSELDAAGRRRYRAAVQAVFQDPFDSLDPRQRVAKTVREPLLRLGVVDSRREADRRVAETLELVGLRQEVMSSYPHELSGSAQQRVGIARALATRPRFIVLDEPTSALSPIARAEVMRTLHDVQEATGVAYLFITHDLAVVQSLAQRVAVMYLGKIVEDGPAIDVFDRRLHPYSEALLSSVLFPDPGAARAFRVLRGEIPSPIDLPTGCAFASRCRLAKDECRLAPPPLAVPATVGASEHAVACVLGDARALEQRDRDTVPS
jgi:oligopeptide/dipeptide ABC transporter ATP-binding protein